MLTKNDLQQIRGIVKGEVGVIDQKLDKVQEDISEILSEVIGHHDKLEKRVDFIEEHLDLPKPQ
ncbi:MAG: hypothetical protein AAB521_00920 [Patescibacteria group bacterium]